MHPRPKIGLFGLGSPHGDDQIGWEVVGTFRECCTEAVTKACLLSPWDLLDHLYSERSVIIVDACRSDRAIGTVFEVSPEELSKIAWGATTHSGSLCEILDLARQLARFPAHLVILGIEVESTDPGSAMTPEVRKAIPVAKVWLQNRITAWNQDFPGNPTGEA